MISIQVANIVKRSKEKSSPIPTLKNDNNEPMFELPSQKSIKNSAEGREVNETPVEALAIKLEDFAVDAGLHENDEEDSGENKKQQKTALELLSEKKTKLFDVSTNNHDIARYCQSLLNLKFHGQCENEPKTRLSYFLDEPDDNMSLALFLQSMDSFLRSFPTNENIEGEEEEFIYYLQGLMEKRSKCDRDVFLKDAKRFLKVYKARGSFPSEELNHTDYWGSRQQLLAGKVIGDFVDILNGPLDPIFGVLLCPVAGRAGPGDSGLVHQILFDIDGPLAYHSAVHDAFGYLITFHSLGPGYNYIGSQTVLEATQCMSGQMSGLYFWRELLKSYRSQKDAKALPENEHI